MLSLKDLCSFPLLIHTYLILGLTSYSHMESADMTASFTYVIPPLFFIEVPVKTQETDVYA